MFLAVRRKQQSSAHASSLARVSTNLPLSPTTHAPTTFSLPPGASLYPTHSPPCLSPLCALERERRYWLRRLCSITGTKASVNPCLASTTVSRCQNKAPNVRKSHGTSSSMTTVTTTSRWRCYHVVARRLVRSPSQTVQTEMR